MEKRTKKSFSDKYSNYNIIKTFGPNKFAFSSLDKKLSAMDLNSLNEEKKKIFSENIDEFYKEIDIPNPGDWLWTYKETGQTFKNYISGEINTPTKSRNKIYIQNLDQDIEEINSFLTEEMLETLRILLELYYPGINAVINLVKNNFETLGVPSRYNSPYFQYDAGYTLKKLCHKLPKDGLLIIGLTSVDIYPQDDWNFVFGLANKHINCGVFSFRRYYDEIQANFDFTKNSQSDFFDNIVKLSGKVMIHETGHLFGLNHCIFFKCLMNGSNHMEENLKKPFEFCPVCLRKIWGNLKFDIIKRFENLEKGLKSLNENIYKNEIDWYRRRIDSLIHK